MLIGWGKRVRVAYLRSEGSQEEIDAAIAALEKAGCDRVVLDSAPRSRPQSSAAFSAFLQRMNPGDTLVVTDLGQLARSTSDLVELLADLIDRGITVQTLSGGLDTGDPTTAHTFMQLAAFDQRVRQGRKRSAASPGRPRRLSADEIAEARQTIEAKRQPVAEVARRLGVSRATLYRALRHR